MSEVLEGVLSETILDELATDLGIEADVLRRHPFFRVYRGRILLTYPLKTQDLQFSEYSLNNEAIAAGATFTPAAGTIVMGAFLFGGAQGLDVMEGGSVLMEGGDLGAGTSGYIGAIYCDGSRRNFKNTHVAEQPLFLLGLSTELAE